jgi:DNA-binding Lrp family transcriptional regulator
LAALRSETVRLPDWFRRIGEFSKQLDPTNIKIMSTMWEAGPRNILEVSRRTKMPFTSVYHRIDRWEAKWGRIAYLIPQVAQLGMKRIILLVSAAQGSEEKVTAALKLPNLWRSINTCEGSLTHESVHTVPVEFLEEFKKYVKELSKTGMITNSVWIETGDYIPNFPDFDYYSPATKQWRFEWSRWLTALRNSRITEVIGDPKDYSRKADLKDMLIVQELELNARKSFAELAPILGITLQAVKYRFDRRLIPSGIVKYYNYDMVPFPVEASAYHEVMLEFTSAKAMNSFYSLMNQLFFVLGVAKVLGRNALVARTYILQSQSRSMFTWLSQLVNAGILESYSAVRLAFEGRQMQTISPELFDDERGWTFDYEKCLAELKKLSRSKASLFSYQPTS